MSWSLFQCGLLPQRRQWTFITDRVLLGPVPFTWNVGQLCDLGVTAVVNMCEEWQGPVRQYQQAAITQLHLPTRDYAPPSADDVVRGIEFIDSEVDRGGTVYVHCRAGRLRAPTLIVCWLILSQKYSPTEAEKLIRGRAPIVEKRLPYHTIVALAANPDTSQPNAL